VNVRDDSGSLIYDEYNDQKIDDVWDIPFMGATSPERLGYPTQEPETVLDFVIRSATGEGDLVLDAFAGSGTTLAVAEKHRRRWVGIDSGKLAIYTIQKRFLNLKEGIGNNGPALRSLCAGG
jgi:site-specific DNA-methyltransferase (adenine-specific)/adenine-specific DNA-methyltransferase